MSYRLKLFLWIIGLIIFAVIISLIAFSDESSKNNEQQASQNVVTFVCSENATIQADFKKRAVNLKLSDGRHLMLKQARSASGARYTDDDESLVFWNKGNTAFITENNSTTYGNCVMKGEDDLTNLKSYEHKDLHFQFRYPGVLKKYRASVSDTLGWSYESTVKGELIVQFQFSDSLQPNTNLSEATFSIGRSDDKTAVANCMKSPQATVSKWDTIQKVGTTFLRSRYTETGAGNYYQVRRFRALYQNSCFSIEEMVHSTNIHNYPAERGISEFDSTRVLKALDVPWQTFRFTRN